MTTPPPVPAAPASLDPLLMPRRASGPPLLGAPVSELRVLVLGLCPITAAAAVMLAGCGVRGFTVVDDGRVTWAEARAGAFDSTEVGRCRELCTRRRIRAANAEAAPVTWTDDVLTDERPGRVVLRSSRAVSRPGGGVAVEAPGDQLPLPAAVPLVDVMSLAGGGAVLLWPERPWHRRPCPACREAAAGGAASQPGSRADPGPAANRAAGPAHTAFCAALVTQTVLAAAAGAEPGPEDGHLLLRAGRPLSTCTAVAAAGVECPLCTA